MLRSGTGPSQESGGCFSFRQFTPLVDRELELVEPAEQWLEPMLAGCRHPLTAAEGSAESRMTRRQLEQFLRSAPQGRYPGNPQNMQPPCYTFWMRLRPEYQPVLPIAGSISLRIGQDADLQLYYGHIGYYVFPAARGNHYAERACRLLLDLARYHGLRPLWITADPANLASRRTCERLGAILVETVDVPPGHPLYLRGEIRKCRYRLDL